MTFQGLIRLCRGECSLDYVRQRLIGIACRLLRQRAHGRWWFEHTYREPDPWDCAHSAYELAKYAETLSALPTPHVRRALEIGCGIGVFTQQLSPRADHLDALDISSRAIARARQRCRDLRPVVFHRCDLLSYSAAEPYDLTLCAEVLYYLWEIPVERASVCAQLAALTAPGGFLVIVMPGETSDQNWDELLVATGHFTLRNHRVYPDPVRSYRISILTRVDGNHPRP